jgi:TetR/AcrR family transcriptional regulator, transcriptional repressor for nem operon
MSQSASGDRKAASRARILEVGGRAVRRAGFHGVGIADVMKEAGLTHGGFYAHFASRDALLCAAVEQAAADSIAAMEAQAHRLVAAGVSPFRAMLETYLYEGVIADRECGCAMAALSSEMPIQSEPVVAASREVARRLQRHVQRALPPDLPADAAWAITATLLGALQLARTLGDNDEGRAVLAATRRELLARYAPA